MAINIFGNFLKKDTKENLNYLSLVLTQDKVSALIWMFEEESIKVLGYSEKPFENVDSLIHNAAEAIDSAGKFAKSDVREVVYGLSSYWFDGGSISKESSNILKNLSEDLVLNAQAFVPLAASINHLLKIKNEKPLSALLLGVLGDFTEIHVIKDNKVANTKVYKSRPSLEKIGQLIRQLKLEDPTGLPVKIVVYGTKHNSHIAGEIEREEWKDIFANKPQVEFLEDEDIALSVAISQAADVLGHDPTLQVAAMPIANTQPNREEVLSSEEEKISVAEKPIQTQAQDIDDNLGFVAGVDVLKNNDEPKPEPASKPYSAGKDEEYAVEIEQSPGSQVHQHTTPKELIEKFQERESTKKTSLIDKITTLGYLPKFAANLTKGSFIKKLIVPLIVLLILMAGLSYLLGKTISKVEVSIKVNAKPLEQEFDATVVNGSSIDVVKSKLPGREIKATETAIQKATIASKKKIGNFAKGEVTVLNWTTQKTNLDKDTVIISKNGVKFELDSQLEVASRSASTPGEAKVNVQAQNFGSAGNVPAGSEFTFQEYDDLLFSARNENATIGGDEKEVTVVTKEDMDRLEKSLLDLLTQKAKEKLKEQSTGQNLTDDTITIKVTKKVFDRQVDDEASILNLDMEVEAAVLIYDENDLKELLALGLEDSQTGSNLEARKENIEILDMDSKRAKDTIILSGKFRANLVPKINDSDVKEKIKGKSTKDARTLLKQIAEVADVTFNFSPPFLPINSLPGKIESITLKIETVK